LKYSSPTEPWLSDDEQAAWRAYLISGRLLMEALDRQLRADAGIPHTWFGVLAVLSEQPERTMSLSQLGSLSFFSLSRLSHAANAMVDTGWLSRRADPEDKRSTLVTLTATGLAALDEMARGHAATVRRLFIDPMTPTQLKHLTDGCQAVLTGLDPGPSDPDSAAAPPRGHDARRRGVGRAGRDRSR
jgi:DNA-binding MarR family transcriptional regulator